MNDFTKEELQNIAYGLECCGMLNSDLRKKVLSMIDNYCEHEEEYEDFNYAPMRCKKCLEITG
jgi:hypothetical protein